MHTLALTLWVEKEVDPTSILQSHRQNFFISQRSSPSVFLFAAWNLANELLADIDNPLS